MNQGARARRTRARRAETAAYHPSARHRLHAALAYAGLAALVAIVILPVAFIVLTSLMSAAEIEARYAPAVLPTNAWGTIRQGTHYAEFALLPTYPTLREYAALLFDTPEVLMYLRNSIGLALPVTVGQTLVSLCTAYAFERMTFRHKEAVFFLYIAVMLLPLQVTLVPNFIVMRWLNLSSSPWAIVLPGIFAPMGVFLCRQQMKALPPSCWEAAQIDGATHMTYFAHILVPLCASAAMALAMLTFVEYWNVVDQAVVFLRDDARVPLSVYLSRIDAGAVGRMLAASVFYMIVPVLVFLLGQDRLIEGIKLSGVKA